MRTERYYYIAQVIGWSTYILISLVVFVLSGTELTIDLLGGIYLVFMLGLITTHSYRYAIIRLGWLELDLFRLLPRVLLSSVGLSVIFHAVYIVLANLLFELHMQLSWTDTNLFTWLMLFFIWNVIYFAYIFFKRYRSEELKNVKLEAARNEFELRRLRDQMNPHFIFNAMNTIRALIDENPSRAKNAVTQLSNVLRSALQTSKEDVITLERELDIVRDYLEIEKARYEERLAVSMDIPEEAKRILIPPLMLQTLVENAIKHGIAKLPKGGEVQIKARLLGDKSLIEISNSGVFNPGPTNGASMGLENTRNRLRLSFGSEASLNIRNDNGTVHTIIELPKPNTK